MKLRTYCKYLFHPQRKNNHRAQILTAKSFFLAFFFVSSLLILEKYGLNILPHPDGLVLGYTSSINSQDVVASTNQKRRAAGLQELQLNVQLSAAAEAKAKDMFTHQYWAHTSPQGKQPWQFITEANYTYLVAGENLARDFDNTERMVTAWMNSPSHKANILHQKYSEIGVAAVGGTLDGVETTLVVQMFGLPDTKVAQPIKTGELLPPVTIEKETVPLAQEVVLADQSVITDNILIKPVIISPIRVLKGVFLAILLIMVVTLVYDFLIVSHTGVVRLVSKNIAHVFLFLTVFYVLIYYKGGIVL